MPSYEDSTLSLHDALPISRSAAKSDHEHSPQLTPQSSQTEDDPGYMPSLPTGARATRRPRALRLRSEEHTSELDSRPHFVGCVQLETKKTPNVWPSHETVS